MTEPDLELGEGESILAVSDDLIYRQITKHLLAPNGAIATHAFVDSDEPSYTQSTIVTAQESRDWHTKHSKSPSLQVRAVTVREVVQSECLVIDDTKAPLEADEIRAPGHCYVDARKLDRVTLKSLRAILWNLANGRGEIPTKEPLEDGELDLTAVSDGTA